MAKSFVFNLKMRFPIQTLTNIQFEIYNKSDMLHVGKLCHGQVFPKDMLFFHEKSLFPMEKSFCHEIFDLRHL